MTKAQTQMFVVKNLYFVFLCCWKNREKKAQGPGSAKGGSALAAHKLSMSHNYTKSNSNMRVPACITYRSRFRGRSTATKKGNPEADTIAFPMSGHMIDFVHPDLITSM